ncbi:MAG: LamG domain-containing protein [Pirellulaceae bacterium]
MRSQRILYVLCLFGSYAFADDGLTVRDNVVADYPFDDNANDASGNGRAGTLYGKPSFTAGKVGQSIVLDGEHDFVDCGPWPSDLAGEFTIECWVKPAAIQNTCADLFGNHFHGALGIALEQDGGNTNQFAAHYGAGGGGAGGGRWVSTRPVRLVADRWQHVAVVKTSEELRLFVNGILLGSVRDSAPVAASSQPFRIGQSLGLDSRCFRGQIDAFRVHRRALAEFREQVSDEDRLDIIVGHFGLTVRPCVASRIFDGEHRPEFEFSYDALEKMPPAVEQITTTLECVDLAGKNHPFEPVTLDAQAGFRDVGVSERLAADIGGHDVDLPSRPYRVGDHVPRFVVDHLSLRLAVIRELVFRVALGLLFRHECLPEVMAEPEQRRIGLGVLPCEWTYLPPAPVRHISGGQFRRERPLRPVRLCRCAHGSARRRIGRDVPQLIRQIQTVVPSQVIVPRPVPPARDMAELDSEIACREIDQNIMPLRPGLLRRHVVDFVRLRDGPLPFLPAAVDLHQGHAARPRMAEVLYPQAIESRARHLERQRYGWPAVPGPAVPGPAVPGPAVPGPARDPFLIDVPTPEFFLAQQFRFHQQSRGRSRRLQRRFREQFLRRQLLCLQEAMKPCDHLGVVAEMPECHAERIARAERFIHQRGRRFRWNNDGTRTRFRGGPDCCPGEQDHGKDAGEGRCSHGWGSPGFHAGIHPPLLASLSPRKMWHGIVPGQVRWGLTNVRPQPPSLSSHRKERRKKAATSRSTPKVIWSAVARHRFPSSMEVLHPSENSHFWLSCMRARSSRVAKRVRTKPSLPRFAKTPQDVAWHRPHRG